MGAVLLPLIKTLENLTIIIPTYNRSKNLIRLIKFYSEINVNIIVLDASENQEFFVNNDQLNYIHLRGSKLHERLLYASKLVTTNYVAICADDDFLFPQGLEKCIEFLEINRDYSCVQGAYIRFKYDNFFSWRPDYVHWNKIEITQNSALERTLQSRKSCQFLYSTMRTSDFNTVTSLFENVSSECITINELAFNYVVPFLGKYRTLPTIYGARIEHAKSSVNLRYCEWIEINDPNCQTYLRNIESVYASKISTLAASELQKKLTQVFVNNDINLLKSVKTISPNLNFRPSLKNVQKIGALRPYSSPERMKWFLFLNKSIIKEIKIIGNFKRFLSCNSIPGTPSL
jgi:glycosyltransferase domain-containing protein